jgi:hypothetical protein
MRRCDAHLSADGCIRAFDRPKGITDSRFAAAMLDRLLQQYDAPHELACAQIEIRLIGRITEGWAQMKSIAMSATSSSPAVATYHQPSDVPWATCHKPARARTAATQGNMRLMKARSQARGPGPGSSRCTLDHEHGSLGARHRHPPTRRGVGPLGGPQAVADAHLATAALDCLLHHQ